VLVVKIEKSTEDIIKELKRGRDREANFKLLFDRYYDQLHRFFQRKGISPEDCRDLTQEVFVSAYKGLKGLRNESQFQNWLFRIARNIHKNEIERRQAKKREAKEVSLEGARSELNDSRGRAEQIADSDPNPIDALLEKEGRHKLSEAVRRLPPQMRRCVQLRVVKGLSHGEIAAIMGISVNTVKAHLHQARKTLKEKLGHLTGMKM
jgi:RNA polymerase sigma-70 factor (ECF subfamily)